MWRECVQIFIFLFNFKLLALFCDNVLCCAKRWNLKPNLVFIWCNVWRSDLGLTLGSPSVSVKNLHINGKKHKTPQLSGSLGVLPCLGYKTPFPWTPRSPDAPSCEELRELSLSWRGGNTPAPQVPHQHPRCASGHFQKAWLNFFDVDFFSFNEVIIIIIIITITTTTKWEPKHFYSCFNYQTEAKSLFLLRLTAGYYELDNIGIDFQTVTLPELTSILTHKRLHTVFGKSKAEELCNNSIQLERIQAILRLLLTCVR